MPAFPPEEEMKRVAPRRAYSSQASPIPRILNEPGGCDVSIFNQIAFPDNADNERDSSRGVSICNLVLDMFQRLLHIRAQVVEILNAAGIPHEGLGNPQFGALLRRAFDMTGGARRPGQRIDRAQTCGTLSQPQSIQEA